MPAAGQRGVWHQVDPDVAMTALMRAGMRAKRQRFADMVDEELSR